MAARSHVDTSINERRLRPIYDCLDNGNNKKAVQEADKVLKKQKDFQCAKILKALALLRLGRQEDAIKFLQEVHADVPTDDATLQAMTICYRELHKLDMIAEIYALASQKDPQNEELLTHLFMAYVRLGQYKKQQQVAMNLYKLKSKNPYYFWGVMSVVMQAHVAPKDIAQKMLLPLAERMTSKFVNESKIEAEAEVQLYLLILELEQKYEEALNVLEGPLGNKLITLTNYKAIKKAELLVKLEKWPEVNIAYKTLIVESPDSWQFYTIYFSSILKMVTSNFKQSEIDFKSDEVDETFKKAETFIKFIIEKNGREKSCHYRAPLLAYIKLVCLARETGHSDEIEETLINLIKIYFQEFGDKPCCFFDMLTFLSSLKEEEIPKLISVIKSLLSDDDVGDTDFTITNVRQMQRHLVLMEICQFYGLHDKLNVAEKFQLCQDLVTKYQQTIKFGADLAVTDIRPNDMYCILATHILMSVYQETGDFTIFQRCLIMLEAALKNSPSSYQIKFLLVKLYSKIGAVGPVFSLYENMDIKHIQQDVLGYLIIPLMIAKGHFSQACVVYGNMLKFYTANHKDTVDHLITSYKFGSFIKIQEFVDFRERLDNSIQYACVTAERMIQDLIFEIASHQTTEQIILYMEIDPEKDKTQWEDLVDNRDLNIMISWEPKFKEKMEDLKSSSFEAELQWLKLRNLCIRCISAAHSFSRHFTCIDEPRIDNCNSVENGTHRNPGDVLQELVLQFREIIESYKPDVLKSPKNILQQLSNSRIYAHMAGGFSRPVLELFQLLLHLPKAVETNDTDIEEKCEYLIKNSIPKELKDCLTVVDGLLTRETIEDFTKVGEILENLVNIAEMLSFVVILLGFCEVILRPTKGGGTKRHRKKKGTQIQLPSVIESFNELILQIEKMTNDLKEQIQVLQAESLVQEFDSMFLCNVLPDNKEINLAIDVPNKIIKSYHQSLFGIDELLRCKLKYMGSLKL